MRRLDGRLWGDCLGVGNLNDVVCLSSTLAGNLGIGLVLSSAVCTGI